MYKKLPIIKSKTNDRASKFVIACLGIAYSYKTGNHSSNRNQYNEIMNYGITAQQDSLEYWLQTSDMYYKGQYPLNMEIALKRTFKTYVPHFNAYQIRVATVEDVFLDHRFNTQNKPFTVNHTPVVNLPYTYREQVANHIMNEFNINNFIRETATNPIAQDIVEKAISSPLNQSVNPFNPNKLVDKLDNESNQLSSSNLQSPTNPSGFNPLSTKPEDLRLMNPALNILDTKGFNELIKLYADVGKVILTNKAKKSAKAMEDLMYDQMVQTNFKQKVFTKMIGYLARYPITVVKGATFINSSKCNPISYDKDYTPVYDHNYSLSLGFESINPYNIFFYDDAETLNNSSCVIDISYHTPSDFSPFLGSVDPDYYTNGEIDKVNTKDPSSPNYIDPKDRLDYKHSGSSKSSSLYKLYQQERLLKAMEKMRSSYASTNGISSYVSSFGVGEHSIKNSYMYKTYWSGGSIKSSSSIPKVNMTKKMMGWEIKEEIYGVKPVKSNSYDNYESTATKLTISMTHELSQEEKDAIEKIKDYDAYIVSMEVVCDEVIMAYYRPYTPDSMGYYASSFRNEPDKIVGTGLCELIKPIQDQINDILISMCRAIQWEARGLTLIDEELIDPASLNGGYQIEPGQTIRTKQAEDGAASGQSGRTPVQRINPNTSNHRNFYITLSDLMRDADELTGIHGTLSGISRSSSENRVGSIYTTKVNYAMKPIQRMANGVDANIIEPMFADLYQKNMMYHWDDRIKGDSTLMIEGATGMLSRNLKQENMMNTLQIVQQGVAVKAFDNKVLSGVLTEMLETNGYDIDAEKIRSDINSLPEAQDIINEQNRINQEQQLQEIQRQQLINQGLQGDDTTLQNVSPAQAVANNPNLPPDVAQAMAGSLNSTQNPNRVDSAGVPNQLGNTLNVDESASQIPSVAPNVQTVDGEQLV